MCFTSSQLVGNGLVIPSGPLREKLSNLRNAEIVIINGKKNFIRGDHAHKKCSQFVFPVLGKIRVDCVSANGKKSILLDFNKKEGYLLKPKTWCRIKFLTKNAT